MKITINHVKGCEPEVAVTYDDLTPEVARVLDFLRGNSQILTGKIEDETVRVKAAAILYIESVDDKTYAYTANQVIRLSYSLTALEEVLDQYGSGNLDGAP